MGYLTIKYRVSRVGGFLLGVVCISTAGAQTVTTSQGIEVIQKTPTSDRSALAELLPRQGQLDGEEIPLQGRFDSELLDADNDGVANIDDNCPESSGRFPVDECGCEIDICPASPIPDGYCAPDRVLRFFDIVFEFDQHKLTPHSKSQLRKLSNEMLRDSAAYLTLLGHTDSVGSKKYNQGLGMRRADIAQRELLRAGVGNHQIQVASLGEEWPAYSNEFETGQANNRRDDMNLGWIAMAKPELPPRYVRVAECGLVRTACKPVGQSSDTEVVIGEVIGFDEDGRGIQQSSMASLRRLAHLADVRLDVHLVVSGNHYNWQTLQVVKRLIIKGVAADRIHVMPSKGGVSANNLVTVKVLAAAPLLHKPVKLSLD